jgi:hypothetical protein
MRRLGLLLSILTVSCSAPAGPSHPVVGVTPDGTPRWVHRGSGAGGGEHGKCFYGVGLLTGVRNEALARQAADNRARAEVAKLFDLYIAAMMKDYQRSTTAGDFKSSAEEQDIVSAQKTITEVTLRGVEIRDHWTDPRTGTLHALAILDTEGIAKSIGATSQLNQRIRSFVRDNSRRAFVDLDRELQRRDHPKLPTCNPGAQLTYLIDDAAQIRTFDPNSASPLTLKGTLRCPLAGQPYSMAVRHDGIAFVLYSRGGRGCSGLARVDLSTLDCQAVAAFGCSQGFGFGGLFGMGYAMAGPAGEETLFVSGLSSSQLGKLDPEAGRITPVAPSATSLELTGNPKGELWGFGPDPSPQAHRLDAASGARLQSFPLSIPIGSGPKSRSWAFAAWGGVFYIFYGEHEQTGGTTVYRLTPDGELTTFLGRTGINIVGAGNAVCAGSVGKSS